MTARHVDPLAAVYAEALADVAQQQGGERLLREVGEAISDLGRAWAADRDLRAYFLSTMVPRPEKRQSLAKLMEAFPPLVVDFVHLLLRRGRGHIVDDVATAYEALLDKRLKRVAVTLATATEVDEDRIRSWTEQLRAALGLEPVVRHVVRPELIAGAVLQVGDAIADGSARRRIAEFQKQVRERGRHALQA